MNLFKKLPIGISLIILSIFTLFVLNTNIVNAGDSGSDDVTVDIRLVPIIPVSFSAVTGACASNSNDGKINLSWNASPGATSYTVTDGGRPVCTVSGTSCVDGGLAVGMGYSNYTIYASNSYGNSGTTFIPATIYASVICTTPPPAVTGFTAVTGACGGNINLSWNASAGAATYTLREGSTFATSTYIGSSTSTSFIHSGLLAGSTHGTYFITATNSYGTSSSSYIPATFTASLQCPPTNFTAVTGACGGRINFSWTAASGATSYTLREGSTVIYTGSSTSYTQTGLLAGSTHGPYTLTFTNPIGTSNPATVASPIYASLQCPPTSFTAVEGSCGGRINLSWGAVSGATNYTLREGSTIIYSGTNTSYIHSGLVPDSAHVSYSLTFTNPIGTSDRGYISTVTNASSACPSGTITASNCTITSGSSSCNSTLVWTTANPIGASTVTTPTGITVATATDGTTTYAVSTGPGTRTFYLYNNAVLLAQATATSTVASNCTWNGTICVGPPTGTITASNCTITSGNSSCNSTLVWTTTNPVGTSTVTTPTGITVATANNSTTTYAVSTGPGTRTFYLYNNAVLLAQATATSTVAANCTWNGTICAPLMSGTLTPTSSTCATSTPSTANCSIGFNWGITNPAGTPTAITASGMTDVNVTNTLATPQSGTQSVTVSPGSRTFYLYNNALQLASSIFTVPTVTTPTSASITSTTAILGGYIVPGSASPSAIWARGTCGGLTANPTTGCVAANTGGTTDGTFSHTRTGLTANTTYHYRAYATNWAGTSYSPDATITTPPAGATTGTLTASGCTISQGGSSCNTTLTWTTTNPIGTSTVRTPNDTGTLIATANNSTTTYAVPYNTRTFVLVNNGTVIATANPIASCTSGTSWSGTACELNTPTTTFTANPSIIFKGKSSTLTWNSDADSCTGSTNTSEVFNTGGLQSGTAIVSPAVNTTYTLTCTNVSGSTVNSVITKVITLKIKED